MTKPRPDESGKPIGPKYWPMDLETTLEGGEHFDGVENATRSGHLFLKTAARLTVITAD